MRDDDLDHEERMRGQKGKDAIATAALKNLLAPFVVMDSAKNAIIAPKTTLKEVLERAAKDYPDSALSESFEGEDVVKEWAPEFSAKNPGTAKVGGFALDVIDPISLLAALPKAPVTLAKGVMKAGDALSDRAVTAWVKKNIKPSKAKEVTRIKDYIKNEGLRGKLGEPEKLIESVSGAEKGYGKKASSGTLDKTGGKLRQVLEAAKEGGAQDVNLGQVKRNVLTGQKGRNSVRGNAPMDLDKLETFIDETVKPTVTKPRPRVPSVPSKSVDDLLASLSDEAAMLKEGVPAAPGTTPRRLEDVLAELSDAQSSKKNLNKTNKSIARENAVPVVEDVLESVDEAWEIKKRLRSQLTELQKTAKIQDVSEPTEKLRRTIMELDNHIEQSLEGIHLPDGSAAGDSYRALNADYGAQSEFLDTLIRARNKDWKKPGSASVAPALVGGTAAAGAAALTGGNVPLALTMGSMAGEGARRVVGDRGPEIAARVGDRLSKPIPAHVTAQTGMELLELPSEHAQTSHDREIEPEEEALPEVPPDLQDALQQHRQRKGRVPQSVPQEDPLDPLDAHMDEVINPQKPLWDKFTNKAILDTPLPRDTERLLANPDAVRAKLGQLAPNYVPVLEDMLANDMEGLKQNAPKLAMMFPVAFERDEYGMFDGKILDPMMQEKFITDVMRDETVGALEQANMIMKVRRNERIY